MIEVGRWGIDEDSVEGRRRWWPGAAEGTIEEGSEDASIDMEDVHARAHNRRRRE